MRNTGRYVLSAETCLSIPLTSRLSWWSWNPSAGSIHLGTVLLGFGLWVSLQPSIMNDGTAETVSLSSCHTSIVQDGVLKSADDIKRSADELAGRLARGRFPLVALTTDRADAVVAALLACSLAECELLLFRQAIPRGSHVWERWRVAALIGDNLSVEPMRYCSSRSPGFSVLLSTSGTTGMPRIARHTLSTLLGRIRPPRPEEPPAVWLLTYHPASFAGIQVLLTSLIVGASCSPLATLKHRR